MLKIMLNHVVILCSINFLIRMKISDKHKCRLVGGISLVVTG